jgi:hypothetical protein
MSRTLKQVLLAVVLVSLLGSVYALKQSTGNRSAGETDLEAQEALRRFGFHLKESARECGIDFTHEAPTLDHRLDHIMPIIASMGAAVSVVDFDRDGWPDLYVVNSKEGSQNRLYRNQHDGTFKDVAPELGVADLNRPGTGVCMGAVWGDFDNDGYEDLLVYKWGRPELFHNDRGKGFTRVTEQAGLPKWVNANNAIWLDYDRDGRLDLFIAGYWPDGVDLCDLKGKTRMMPESFEYANNGGRKYLLRNKGDGTFEDVTVSVGILSARWTLAAAAADLCGTGYPDLVLANDYGISEFYANRHGQRFEEVGARTGIAEKPKSGMNVSFGDVFNQGRLAVYISNITEPGNLVQGNWLWVPEGKTRDGYPHYVNQAGELKVERGGWSWGAQFGDLNNDGLLDLYLTNGYVSADRGTSYWYDYSLIASAHSAIIGDAAKWPVMGNKTLAGYEQKCVWLNNGDDFTDVGRAVGVNDTCDGRAVALADLFNRGVLDVIVANQKGPLLVYKNTVAGGRDWVQFELEGTRSNRSAIGAEVRLFWKDREGGERQQVQVVSGGNGYAAQNMRRLHFGLGAGATIEKAVIRWPSHTTQTIPAPQANRVHQVKEPVR